MMVRPYAFRANAETADTNYFQVTENETDPAETTRMAQEEFDSLVEKLRSAGIRVIVFQDDAYPDTPDAVFPNNWVSFHADGRIVVYPMYAPSRRGERREEMFDIIADDFGFEVEEIEDFSHFEDEGIYLEGTGSMVLDRANQIVYAAIGPRTDIQALETFCDRFDYEYVAFTAVHKVGEERKPIYHTNVMMGMGSSFVVVCLNAIDNTRDKQGVLENLKSSGRKLVEISESQMDNFAGNILCLQGNQGKEICVMSSRAFQSLRKDQIELIQKYATIVHSPLDTIEKLGGGSARCMMAEVFLPESK